ncbi:MAG: 1-acyl-sn-glycerol-3-phosphate acyltransferase [Candidatus Omnitrophota bacterium]|nr:MAG: 1-acyl-sn-glycerol-3-phosphate acyltransferase [Candidatus Omnitrophota bacterium]
MFYSIIRFIAVVLYKVLFRIQVFGRENIPSNGGFILAGNHASYLDPPALAVACPRQVYFLAKEELFVGLFGRLITKLHAFPVKGQPGELIALRRAIKELQSGRVLLVFPEGRRTADGEFDRPRPGVGFLAVRAGVPIVPAFIEGSNRALPVHSKFIRPVKIRVYFGRPFFPEAAAELDREELYQKVAARTMEEIGRLKDKAIHGN